MKKLSESEKQKLREELQEMSADKLAKVAKGADRTANRFTIGASLFLLWLVYPVGILLGIIFIFMKDRRRLGVYMILGAVGFFLLSFIIVLLRQLA